MSTFHKRMAQQPSTDPLVELYELDTTPLNAVYGNSSPGTVYLWTPGSIGGQVVSFGGAHYQPMPIEGVGWEWNGQGKLPQPKLQISNVGNLAAALVIAYGDLVGCQVTRLRVFASCLDGQPNADSSAYFEPDIFTINRKSGHTKTYVEFELRASFDAQGLLLPRRQIIKDTCGQSYRQWNGSSFVYGTCPYTGGNFFAIDDSATGDPAKDVCSKRLTGCIARFGPTAALPFGGFPGVGSAPGVA